MILICLIFKPQFLVRLGYLRVRRRRRLSVSLLKPRSASSVKDRKGSAVCGRRKKRNEPIRLAVVIKREGITIRIRQAAGRSFTRWVP